MKLLALDTATELCSTALCIEGVCQTRECERARGSGELILGMLAQLLEEAGLAVQLVNPSQARNLPGRPKTDKLDCIWLCKVAERQMIRPSFVRW